MAATNTVEIIWALALVSQVVFPVPAVAEVQEFRIGVWYPTTKEDVLVMYKPVFEDYLNRAVDKSLNVTFTVVPVDFDPTDTAENSISENKIDFFYSMAGRMACVEVEFDWIVIATARIRALGREAGAQGTIIYSLKSNSAIQTVGDFKGKRIGLAHILSSSFYLSKQVLDEDGVHIFKDAAQVAFYGNDYDAQMLDVLKEKMDVGFTASSIMFQRYAASIPQLRFHALLPNASFEGEVYPLPTSTPLTPQMSLAASPDVPTTVKWAVTRALMNLDPNTPEAQAASLSNFTTAASHFNVRTSMTKANLFGAPGGRCFSPFDDMRDIVTCPDGYVVDTERGLGGRCAANKITCPDGIPCYCGPCIPTTRVNIFPSEVVLGLACTLFVINLAVVVFWGFGMELSRCLRAPVWTVREKAGALLRRRRRRSVAKHVAYM